MSGMMGRTLSHYQILEKLGSGGMGDVYKALDTKLNRTVALKVLPRELASDPERRQRFEQEARAASALDHVNIITIHDILEADGTHFIVMQYVEGRSLRELMQKGSLDLKEALLYATQIAEGLSRAHGKGIVHRDLKPDNVMVTEDGLVKILDFGLAKLTEPGELSEAATRDLDIKTKEGHILGTAPYMSPEQAQGKSIDARSDVFSFGSVLYEMVTGRRAFAAASLPELLTAIIREEPRKVSELLPSAPLDLERLISRALRKEPERRFQSMADMKVEIQDLKETLDSGSFVSAEQVTGMAVRHRGKTWPWLAAAVAAMVAAVAGWLYLSSLETVRAPPRTLPLTAYPGEEGLPALSPDGSLVAFIRFGDSPTFDLYVKMIDGGEPLLLSSGSQVIHSTAWSPDSRQIAFMRRAEGDDGNLMDGLFVVPVLGGGERRLGTFRAGKSRGLSWSPDGKLFAIPHREQREGQASIYLFAPETGEMRRLTTTPADYVVGDSYPRFSPDGKTVAFFRENMGNVSDIYLIPVDGGGDHRLTFDGSHTMGLDWTEDGESIVFSSTRSPRGTAFSLWRVSAAGGEPEPLKVGEQGILPTLSRQGARLSYVSTRLVYDIWRVGGPSAVDQTEPLPHIISKRGDAFPQYSPDGEKIVYCSGRTGYQEIWISDHDGTTPRQVTFLEAQVTNSPSWSPDGQQIAFQSTKEGSYDIFTVGADGGPPHRVTTESWGELSPSWSRDGQWIYFSSNQSGSPEIWKTPARGGKPTRVLDKATTCLESPDGRFLYFSKRSPAIPGPLGIWRIPVDGGEEKQVIEHTGFRDWAIFEKGICYINRQADPGPAIEFYDFETGGIRTVTVLEDQPGNYGFSVSPDGRWILFEHVEIHGEIMLVENFR
jgi:Tol biopolymer transport system component/predicted Ser/Thr protein kinase